ncbi:MAG: filamentous hemagglutinin N-terminal domain-containing protein, partial [Alphaproteobacteria bacterium]|nr:filamentous hemagglutinin N-terminal domain-containing protein [Alphaproteobacteria bacterium]
MLHLVKSTMTTKREGWTFRNTLLASTALCRPMAIGLSLLIGTGPAMALPQGGSVAGGAATIIQTAPKTLTINQSTKNAILNWQSFNIASGETTRFNQPSASSFTLNRITGGDPAQILGTLSANGGVMIVDPNGVIFGKGSKVDVNRIVASTADIKNNDFMAGKYNFATPGNTNAMVVNQGTVTVADSGLAAFVAPGVENSGIIVARLGKVNLASASTFTLDLYGDRLVNVAVSGAVLQKLTDLDGKPLAANIQNSGKILADGGQVVLSASAAREAVNEVINSSGVIQARTASIQSGDIILDGGEAGTVVVSGTLDASGKGAGQTGGSVVVTGQTVAVGSSAVIDASGAAGGGVVKVSGGTNDRDASVRNANTTTIASGAQVSVDALDKGNGGSITVWGNSAATVDGILTARGGTQGGNGGAVETSGARVYVNGAKVNTLAPKGNSGMWVIDPYDVVIGVGGDMDPNSLATSLNSSPMTISTTLAWGHSNGASGDITVSSQLSWTSTASLTLIADRNININANIISASGYLVLRPNNANAGVLTTDPTSPSYQYTGSVIFAGGVSVPANTTIKYISPTVFTVAASGGTSGATLTPTQLVNELALADVNINNSNATTDNIIVNNALSWASSRSLTLNAVGNVVINAGITASDPSATLTLSPGVGSTAGVVSFGGASGVAVPTNTTILYSPTTSFTISSGGNLTAAQLDSDLALAKVTIDSSA